MFASHHERQTRGFAARLGSVLAQRGLDLHERVLFLAPFVPHGHYLGLNGVCDVMIDTQHWSGGNTSLDALAMGLPVVTCPGSLMRGRQSQAMLRILGVDELVTSSPAALVETVLRVGSDRDLRADLSGRILARRAELFERDEPVRALEEFLLNAASAAG
jgi:CRISPR-associated protein Csy1